MPKYTVYFVEEERSRTGALKRARYSTETYHTDNIKTLVSTLWMNLPSSKVDQIQEIRTESDAQRPIDRAEKVKKEIRGK